MIRHSIRRRIIRNSAFAAVAALGVSRASALDQVFVDHFNNGVVVFEITGPNPQRVRIPLKGRGDL